MWLIAEPPSEKSHSSGCKGFDGQPCFTKAFILLYSSAFVLLWSAEWASLAAIMAQRPGRNVFVQG